MMNDEDLKEEQANVSSEAVVLDEEENQALRGRDLKKLAYKKLAQKFHSENAAQVSVVSYPIHWIYMGNNR